MVADMVSSHPDVTASDEVPRPAVNSICDAIKHFDKKKNRNEAVRDDWTAVRQDYFLNALANSYFRQSDGLRFCNKTPSTELYFERIMWACNSQPPLFVYCVRHPHKVLRSLMRMPWNDKTLEERVNLLASSVQQLDDMQYGGVDVKVVQIDKVDAKERLTFGQSLMDFLQLRMTDQVSDYLVRWPVAQPAENVIGAAKGAEIDEAALAASKPLSDICARFYYPPSA